MGKRGGEPPNLWKSAKMVGNLKIILENHALNRISWKTVNTLGGGKMRNQWEIVENPPK